MPLLAIILLDTYEPAALEKGFRAAFAELGLASLFRSGENILIKPNLLSAVSPEKAVTPHPEVFRALALALRRLDVSLTFGDSPASDLPDRVARSCGIGAVADELAIPLANFIEKQDCALPQGQVLKNLPLALGVAEADGLVSLAKLKTHALIGLTGVIKNLFGVVPGMRKATYHANFEDREMFCQMLTDIAVYIRPRLSVLDGIVAMEGNGPRNGSPRKVGAVLLSADPVAVDAAAAFLVNMKPDSIDSTRLAAMAGLGEINLAAVEACLIRPNESGETIQRGPANQLLRGHVVADFVPAIRWQPAKTLVEAIGRPILKSFILNRPVIDRSICVRCGACAVSCPLQPKAVTQSVSGSLPAYDYKRCIRCYCCQEICPVGAIDVRRTLIGKLLNT